MRRRPPEPYAWSLSGSVRGLRADLQELFLFPIVRRIARLRIKGDRPEDNGPFVIVANHNSHLDCPVILASLPRRLRTRTVVAAAADYFYKTKTVGALASLALGTIPFERHEGARDSLDRLKEALSRGWSVLIFPEGTRSTTGDMQAFKKGAAFLAVDTRTAALPVWIEGARDLMPKGRLLPRRGRVTLRFGEPVGPRPSDDYDSFTARLENAVANLGEGEAA